MTDALVIGAGPAGLMAAQALAQAGHSVLVAEAKPSPARKLLMAGKSGLNLTKAEDTEPFLAAYCEATPHLRPMLDVFGPDQVIQWAENLGQPVFTGSTGRVFPKSMKASPLLRAWLAQLDALNVMLRTRWFWQGWEGTTTLFSTPEGPVRLTAKATVLACGGASWSRLGSDGAWVSHLDTDAIAPFQPANMGFIVNWSNHMHRHFGAPVKDVALHAGDQVSRGECVLSQRGIEGGGIYAISRALRDGAPLSLDLVPNLSMNQVRKKLGRPRGKASRSNHLRKTLRLDPVKLALLMEFGRPLPNDIAPLIKCLPVMHQGPRPLDEAISVAGGIRFDALDSDLMLHTRPGVFAAGEMLDWEAPTGGYLLTACLATGLWAGQSATRWLGGQKRPA